VAKRFDHQTAQEISYASSAATMAGRVAIRTLENLTGRRGLIRRAQTCRSDIAGGQNIWNAVAARFGVTVNIGAGGVPDIPSQGPLVVVANHPFGILDGLAMAQILTQARDKFRILANSVFAQTPDIEENIFSIDFTASKVAQAANIKVRRQVVEYLRGGGALGVFPGGTVSTARNRMAVPLDPAWRNFTGRLILKSNATVVPIYFEGANSPLFQTASRLHSTLRLGLLLREFKIRVDQPVNVVIGKPIAPDKLAEYRHDLPAMMDFLRAATYGLSPGPRKPLPYGYEFEEKYRKNGSRRF